MRLLEGEGNAHASTSMISVGSEQKVQVGLHKLMSVLFF